MDLPNHPNHLLETYGLIKKSCAILYNTLFIEQGFVNPSCETCVFKWKNPSFQGHTEEIFKDTTQGI